MSDIEKATWAMRIVLRELAHDRRWYALQITLMAYQCDEQQAERFVQMAEDIYNMGN